VVNEFTPGSVLPSGAADASGVKVGGAPP
jgi:hypothetical protein